jgi:hypothetical protein
MVRTFKKWAWALTFVVAVPGAPVSASAGLNGWGARYAAAEEQRLLKAANPSVAQTESAFAGADDETGPPTKTAERSTAMEIARFAAALLIPGLGLILWLAD